MQFGGATFAGLTVLRRTPISRKTIIFFPLFFCPRPPLFLLPPLSPLLPPSALLLLRFFLFHLSVFSTIIFVFILRSTTIITYHGDTERALGIGYNVNRTGTWTRFGGASRKSFGSCI